jgi:4-amino-4-deoxy-L-arabinose transferase-like glycosyltransferase
MNLNPIYHRLILAVVCVFSFFVHLGVFEPDLMEARNFVTAREMAQEGNYLLPTMNGAPRLEKPPLPTWFTAAAYGVFGESLFFLRLPAALIASLMVFALYYFAKKVFINEEQALVSALALASFPLMIEMGRTGSWDVFCQAFMLLGVFYLYQAFRSGKAVLRAYFLAGIFIGLSAMSKGPVALYGMLLPFLIAYGIVFGMSHLKRQKKEVLLMLGVAIVLATWWYFYVRVEAPAVSTQIANKEMAAWANRHTRPFWFYLNFPLFSGIWVVLLLAAFWYKGIKRKTDLPKEYRFVILWMLITLVLLSVIPEKKERYLLPILPPVALLIGFAFRTIKTGQSFKMEKAVFYGFGILLLTALWAAPVALYFLFLNSELMPKTTFIAFVVALMILAGIVIAGIRKKSMMQLIYSAMACLAVVMLCLTPSLPEFKYKNPAYKEIGVIRIQDWYATHEFCTDLDINLKAIWRIGKPVRTISLAEEWPKEAFVLVTENSPTTLLRSLNKRTNALEHLGTFDYFRKKSKYKLHVFKVPSAENQ